MIVEKKSVENSKYIVSVFPFYVTFCITSICNAKCKHCSSWNYNHDNLSTEKIIKILEELASCGVMQIGFSGGEPLLHPDFDEIIKRAIELDFIIGVGTNGRTINEEIVTKIKKLKIHKIQVSLDGNNSHTHNDFRGVDGLFEEAISGIELMISKGISVNVCMTDQRQLKLPT